LEGTNLGLRGFLVEAPVELSGWLVPDLSWLGPWLWEPPLKRWENFGGAGRNWGGKPRRNWGGLTQGGLKLLYEGKGGPSQKKRVPRGFLGGYRANLYTPGVFSL